MTRTEEEELMELTKEVKKKIDLNAMEVILILEVMRQYQKRIDAAFKLKRHRSNKEFIETRQLTKALVDKFEDIHKENKEEFEKLTEIKKSSKN